MTERYVVQKTLYEQYICDLIDAKTHDFFLLRLKLIREQLGVEPVLNNGETLLNLEIRSIQRNIKSLEGRIADSREEEAVGFYKKELEKLRDKLEEIQNQNNKE